MKKIFTFLFILVALFLFSSVSSFGQAEELWVNMTADTDVIPGEVITYTITYGNSGDVIAQNAIITLQLPTTSGYYTLFGSPIPDGSYATANTITWDSSDIPSLEHLGSGPYTIQVKIKAGTQKYLGDGSSGFYMPNASPQTTVITTTASIKSDATTTPEEKGINTDVVEISKADVTDVNGTIKSSTGALAYHLIKVENKGNIYDNFDLKIDPNNLLGYDCDDSGPQEFEDLQGIILNLSDQIVTETGWLSPGQSKYFFVRKETPTGTNPSVHSTDHYNCMDIYGISQVSGNQDDGTTTTIVVGSSNDPLLSMSKIASPEPVGRGEILTYTIYIFNSNDKADATGAVLTDQLPDGATYVPGSANITPTTLTSTTATWNLGVIGYGPLNAKTIIFKVLVDSEGSCTGSLTNDAILEYTGYAPISASITSNIVSHPDLAITKTSTITEALPLDYISYTINYKNNGTCPVDNVKITDTFDSFRLKHESNSEGVAPDGNSITFEIGTLYPEETATISVELRVKDSGNFPSAGTYSLNNTATISGDDTGTTELDLFNNTSSWPISVKILPDLEITKTVSPALAIGVESTYTIIVSNSGDKPASNVVVKDILPAGLIPVNISGGGILAAGEITWPTIPSFLVTDPAITYTFKVTPDCSDIGPIINTATVSSDTPDKNELDNKAEVSSVVPNSVAPEISVVKKKYNGSDLSCSSASDGEITVIVTGGIGLLSYSNDGGSTYHTSNIFSSLAAGTYQIKVNDDCNTASSSVTITAPSQVVLTATANQPLCYGELGSVSLSTTGGTGTYTYDGANPALSDLTPGSYTFKVKDSNGCEAQKTVTINAAPSGISFTATPTQPKCFGETGSVVLSTPTGGTGTISFNGTATTGLTAGDYTYIATDANGCTKSVTVTINAAPSGISFTATPTQPKCFGETGSVVLSTPTGGTGTISFNGTATTGLTAGDYTYIATDANGCTKSVTVTINAAPSAISFTATPTQPKCFGETGSVVLSTPTGGTGTISFNGTATTGLTAGDYTYIATDANGCTKSVTVTINAAPSGISFTATPTQPKCFGETGSVVLSTPTGGTGTISFNGTATTGLTAGDYTYIATDANGCTKSVTVTINAAPSAISFTATPTQPKCFGETGSVVLSTPTGGTGTISFNGTATTGLTAGDYTYIATDANGCTKSVTVTINAAPSGISFTATPTQPKCFGETGSVVLSTPTGGTGTISFNGTATTGLTAGDYTYIATDANGCTKSVTVTINAAPSAISFTATPTQPKCFGETGSVVLSTPTGGTGTISFNGTATTGLTAGDYTYIATDANGCTKSVTVTINAAPSAISFTATPTQPKCFGETGSVVLSTPTGGTGTISFNGTATTGLTAGDYTYIATDANGCTKSVTVTINAAPSAISFTATPTQPKCFGETGSVVLSTPTGGTGTISFNGTATTGLTAGDYTYIATDANGCTKSVTVTINAAPSGISFTATPTQPKCFGETGSVVLSTPTGGTGTISFNGTATTGLTAGDYTYIATDANGCTKSVTVTINAAPSAISFTATPTQPKCFGETGSVVLSTPTGGTGTISFNGTATTGLTAGDYTYIATDANGCTKSVTVTINAAPSGISFTATPTQPKCFGETGSVVLSTPTGGTGTISFNGTATTGLTAGDYTYIATDANGCTKSVTVTINAAPSAISFTATPTQPKCFGETGSVVLSTPTGGTGTISFNGTATTGLTAGDYTYIATDANGCTKSVTVTINAAPSGISFTATPTQPKCFGETGSVVLSTPTGGTGTISFNGTATTGLTAGDYTYIATDANGCTKSVTVTINAAPSGISFTATPTQPKCFGETGSVVLSTPTGGTGTISFNGTATTGLTAGDYTYIATDANGCTKSVTVTINAAPSGISFTATPTQPKCFGETGSVVLSTPTGGTGTISFNGTATTGLTAGDYTYIATDANGCTKSVTVTINAAPSAISFTATPTQPKCFGETGSVVLSTPTGGTGTISFNGTATTGLTAGDYTYIATDANGCTKSVTVTINAAPSAISFTATPTQPKCFGETGSVVLSTPTGGTGTISFNGTATTGLTAGDYTYIATDANGCTKSVTVTINAAPSAISFTATPTQPKCFGETGSVVLSTPTGGTGTISFNGTATTGLTAGDYTYIATDANGCTKSVTVTINAAPSGISFTATPTQPKCFGETGSVVLSTPTGGTGTISFNGTATTGLTAGDYTYIATDANGCTKSVTVTINAAPSAISFTATPTQPKCFGETGSVVLSTPTGGTGTISFNGTATTGLTAGDYTYIATDANGCTKSVTVTINAAPSGISFTATPTQPKCFGETGSVVLSTPTGGTGTISFNGTATTGLTAGDYTYIATDANGCTKSVTVTINAAPSAISFTATPTQPKCFGETGSVVLSTPTGGTGTISFNGTATTGLTAGDYTYIATDANGCTKSVTVTINAAPSGISFTATPTQPKCFGETGSVVLSTPTGGTGTISFNGTATTGLTAGDYTYIATDANGCTKSVTVTINAAPSAISFTATPTQPKCFGETGSVVLSTPTGGTGTISFNGTATTGLTAGDYTYIATDANGCTKSVTVTINAAPSGISFTATPTQPKCFGETGSVVLSTPTGGTGTISFNGTATTGLTAGDYTYIATDANGCTKSVTVTINAAPSAISATISKSNISCNGSHNGTIIVSASGGNGSYQYSKDNGSTWQASSSFTGLSEGTYSVLVKDANSCSSASQNVTISEPNEVLVSGTTISAKCNGGSDGSIDLTVSGGSGSYSYLWSNGARTADINGLAAGVYTVVVSESNGCSVSGVLSYTVRSLDNTPVARNDVYEINEDLVFNGNVSTNDDPSCDGGNVWSLVSNSSHGSVTFNANGTYVYSPNANFNGTDSFSYKVCDVDNDCSTATVTITILPVNDPPIAINDINITLKNTPVTGNVLTNDNDLEDDVLIVKTTPVIQPTNGKVVVNQDGTYTYTPNSGYSGSDSFVYEVCDNGTPVMCNQAVVTIKIIDLNSVSNAPVAINDVYQGTIDFPVKGSVLSNDFDPDGNINTNSVILVGSAPSNGTLTLNPNGTFTFTPEPGFLGQVSFGYQVCDSGSPIQCDVATVTIDILNKPTTINSTFATDDSFFVKENNPMSGNVLTNDNDPEGDIQTVNMVPVVLPAHGTLVLNANGTISYTPALNYIGLDRFVYEVCDDGTPKACDKGTVYLIIAPVNYIPVAIDDKNTTNEDTFVTGNVSTNDIPSADGGNVWTMVSQPKGGKVVMNTDGTYTYTPNADFNGTDIFTYKVCDVNGDCDEALVSVTVLPVDDSPVANDDLVSFHVDDVLNDWVTDNDAESGDGDNVWSIVTQPTRGTITFNIDGSYTYTPSQNFVGNDTFTYKLCDADGDCDEASVTISVEDVVLPNQVLTPNGDTHNDTFIINGIEFYPENDLTIYNRWGNKVYQKSGYQNEWDGISNENKVGSISLPVGTYFYVLKYGNQRHKTGYVYLDR